MGGGLALLVLLAATQAPEYEVSAPAFFAVQVEDVTETSGWYREVFGLDEVNRFDAPDGRYAIRILAGGGLTVELIQERGVERSAERTAGLFKAGLYIRGLDAFRRSLESRGVEVDADIFVDHALNARSFVFRDPEGNRLQAFELCEGPCDPGPGEEAGR